MSTATSLILIAVGAILAFAVTFSVAGVDIRAIGGILIGVGVLGLIFSLLYMASIPPFAHHDHDHLDRPEY